MTSAWVPPAEAQLKPPAERAEPTLQVPVQKPPAEARENCGTHWTPRIEDPEANVNPCPKGCERGERQLVYTYKQGDKTVYSARYQCYRIPTVARRPPPDDSPFGRARAVIEKPGAKPAGAIEPAGGEWGLFVRVKGPGYGRATGVVGLWYLNDDTSQLPAMRTSVTLAGRLGPDELRIQIPLDPARTGSRGDFSKGTLHIVLQLPNAATAVYAGTFLVGEAAAPGSANSLPGAPTPNAGLMGADAIREAPPAFRRKVVATLPIVLTGTRRAPFVPNAVTTGSIELTGTRRPPFVPKVISTEALRLTGTRLRTIRNITDRKVLQQ